MSAMVNAFISALDSVTPFRTGENGHTEMAWSNDLQEKIVQFDFQCVRTTDDKITELSAILDTLLSALSMKKSNEDLELKRKQMLVSLFKMIGKTRDINGGKGEYALAYMMLHIWYKHYPDLAKFALQLFVSPFTVSSGTSEEPYGSWKDIKYFCRYILSKGAAIDHPLVKYCIDLVNSQIHADELIYDSPDQDVSKKTLSLVSKWVAREGSKKFGQLYSILAYNYFPHYINSAKNEASLAKAQKKCKTQYRIVLSKLNRHLDTIQIKQTSGKWAEIDHSKTTSITMAKQRRVLLNLPLRHGRNEGTVRSEDPDRIQCAENLRAYMESLKKQGKEMKGKNLGLPDFTKQAQAMQTWDVTIPGYIIPKCEEADILNSQWRDNSNKKNANGLGPMVAMCDLSGSMSGDPMAAAIALSCRVAEKSLLGRRVMTFSAEPAWINLDGKMDFTDMASCILSNCRTAGLNTDFYKALDLILTAIEQHRVPPADVENMVLAIFSDMQIDDCLCFQPGSSNYSHTEAQAVAARGKWSTMHEQIKARYAEVGMRMYGQPLKAPHILFWNLRSTDGFPTMSTEAGCSMMSGFDPTILNMFCELGMDALKGLTPYNMLLKQLDNPRYEPLELAMIRAVRDA
jgi:hypothetical protein